MEAPSWWCDVCGKEKADLNHWYAICSWPGTEFKAIPWQEAQEQGILSGLDHVCGQGCAQTAFSRWLDGKPIRSEVKEAQ